VILPFFIFSHDTIGYRELYSPHKKNGKNIKSSTNPFNLLMTITSPNSIGEETKITTGLDILYQFLIERDSLLGIDGISRIHMKWFDDYHGSQCLWMDTKSEIWVLWNASLVENSSQTFVWDRDI
jgi:hypothetical protein